jgi:hypothetical protein
MAGVYIPFDLVCSCFPLSPSLSSPILCHLLLLQRLKACFNNLLLLQTAMREYHGFSWW